MRRVKSVIIATLINAIIVGVLYFVLKYKTLMQLSNLLCYDGSIIMGIGVLGIVGNLMVSINGQNVYFSDVVAKQSERRIRSDLESRGKSLKFLLYCIIIGLIPFLIGTIIKYSI